MKRSLSVSSSEFGLHFCRLVVDESAPGHGRNQAESNRVIASRWSHRFASSLGQQPPSARRELDIRCATRTLKRKGPIFPHSCARKTRTIQYSRKRARPLLNDEELL